ncbi:MAG TPA: DUF2905 domain-containing protein [Candidatus Acidoferrum sp.]|nr:DUF2905 domain-containing protein [Candidatus Acidoferrum sp.]
MPQVGKILIIVGALIIVAGLVMMFADRVPFLGKLPGDIHIKRGNFTIYFPVVTMLVVSILLTVLLNLFGRGR